MENLEEKTKDSPPKKSKEYLERAWEIALRPYLDAAERSDGPFSEEDYNWRANCIV